MRERLGGDRELERRRAPSGSGRASRPRGRRRTAGRARAGSPAARRATGSPGRCAPAARGRGRSRTASASPRSGRTARRSARRRRRARRAACRARTGRRARSCGALPTAAPSRRRARSGHGSPRRSVPPPARCARIRPASIACAGGVERRGRLVEQPDRPRHRDQPGERQPPPLPGRQVGRRQVGRARRARPRRAPLASAGRRRRDSAPRRRVLGDRQRGLQRVLMAEIMRLLGDACARRRRPRARAARRRAAPARRSGAAARICRRRSARSPARPRRRRPQSRARENTCAAAADAGQIGAPQAASAVTGPRPHRGTGSAEPTKSAVLRHAVEIVDLSGRPPKKDLISPSLPRCAAQSRADLRPAPRKQLPVMP